MILCIFPVIFVCMVYACCVLVLSLYHSPPPLVCPLSLSTAACTHQSTHLLQSSHLPSHFRLFLTTIPCLIVAVDGLLRASSSSKSYHGGGFLPACQFSLFILPILIYSMLSSPGFPSQQLCQHLSVRTLSHHRSLLTSVCHHLPTTSTKHLAQ